MTAHGKNVRTSYDVSAAWQPLTRLDGSFNIELEIPESNTYTYTKEFISAIFNVINSKKKWDTPKVKIRKILNVISPSLILFVRQRFYNKKNNQK